jgi:hypothetical protein
MLAFNLHEWAVSGDHEEAGMTVLLSASVMRLVLELQLLAADALQQQQQQAHEIVVAVLLICNALLIRQIQVGLQQTDGSSLPREVLQQAGLQLLQSFGCTSAAAAAAAAAGRARTHKKAYGLND